MNWQSEKHGPDALRWALADDRSDLCEHVEVNRTQAYAVLCEDDCSGLVVRYVVCVSCYAAHEQEEGSRIRRCCDCHKDVQQKEGGEWRWYDFYAAQGDEPMFLCDVCRRLPRHLERRRRDLEDYQEEMARYRQSPMSDGSYDD